MIELLQYMYMCLPPPMGSTRALREGFALLGQALKHEAKDRSGTKVCLALRPAVSIGSLLELDGFLQGGTGQMKSRPGTPGTAIVVDGARCRNTAPTVAAACAACVLVDGISHSRSATTDVIVVVVVQYYLPDCSTGVCRRVAAWAMSRLSLRDSSRETESGWWWWLATGWQGEGGLEAAGGRRGMSNEEEEAASRAYGGQGSSITTVGGGGISSG
ncbi:uncharacterized protein SEPMUDRAFT_111797 [Sphaerulina musiva SO2202]|uniref:Uncharacterized protein n=1 Tax=Sphaerulina musiva (strain SO2202) TaxID=692275 RepID=M3CWF2_SPHMS|nr:uncharacterized protein SEPMUDRAFT_111797 [Sphaerulina musiva SO2202]EMF08452.1 hypothetical protein SEPMUDRAFT_111797 [Sphaerulina musiva SO2202]